NGLDHRANILQDAKVKRVLGVNRRAGQAAVNRTSSEDERKRIQLNRVLWHADNNELPMCRKTGHEPAHSFTAGACRENGLGSPHTLHPPPGSLGDGIVLVLSSQPLPYFFLIAPAADGARAKSNMPRKLATEMPKPANALHGDQVAAAQASIAQ